MDPGSLIPAADAIPIAAGWFRLLLLATFVLHLLAMNAMLGGAVIALAQALGGEGQPRVPPTEQAIAVKLPFTIALTVNLGVPPLLFLQVHYGNLLYTSAVLMAAWWLSIFVLAMVAYYAAYVYDFRLASLGRVRTLVIGLAVLCLLAVAFVFSNSMTLMLKPTAWTAYFANPRGTNLNLADPTLWPRYLHFVLASLAVGGLGLAGLGSWRRRRGDLGGKELVRVGLNWFIWGTLAQMADGLWFLLSLPQEIMLLFLGGSVSHTALLWLGVAMGVGALVLASKGRVPPAAAAALGTVVLMALTRDLLRAAYLKPFFSPEGLPVTAQASPALVFLAALIVGSILIFWLLRLAAGAGKES
ncbi:MAG: hypothetical protein LDL11_03035 [Desulfarculus sp.]|nr:hypothetical protein [Desulfarculus sp.]